jgi:hypothetical protein
MSRPSGEPGSPASAGTFGSVPDDGSGSRRARSRVPLRVVIGILAGILFIGTAVHIGPAIKAGMRDGTRGTWVATSGHCGKTACVWNGKFVLPDGQVRAASAQFAGQLPANLHVGTALPALDTGEKGLVFPASGSDLWISLLVALLVSAVALFWAGRRPLLDYLSQRRKAAVLAGRGR